MSVWDLLDLGHPVLHLIGKSKIGKPFHDEQQANQTKQELHSVDNPSSGMNPLQLHSICPSIYWHFIIVTTPYCVNQSVSTPI